MYFTKPLPMLAACTLVLHGTWEYLHIALYTGYEVMEGVLPVWVLATLGDLLYTFVICATISLVKGNSVWIRNAAWHEVFAAALIGFLVALMVEYKGLYLGRWEYLPSMPIVPFLGIGLSPLLQMTLITPLSLLVTKLLAKRIYQ